MIEILIAASLVTVALLGIASMFPAAKVNVHYGGQMSKAVALVQEMVEIIKNDTFNQITQYNGIDTNDLTTCPTDDTLSIPQFRGGTNCQKWANDIQLYLATGGGITGGYGTVTVQQPVAGLRLLTVTVFWNEGNRGEQSIALNTLIAQ